MTQKILGLDLGTSSIGTAIRNVDLGETLKDQMEYLSVDVFQSGVGKDKTGEYSFAAERTKHRQSRRLYETRRRRLWATLELLIKHHLCPMSPQSLEQWRIYDKDRGLFRRYPVDDIPFAQWIRLDFDGDGKADYSSPYQLREELVTFQFDFEQEINRYKLGRALYHIAQRRGFKSSRGETIAEQEKNGADVDLNDEDIAQAMQKSEANLSAKMQEYMTEHHCPTVGAAFALMEREGIRVRNSEYKAVRRDYILEINKIFEFQDGLDINSDLHLHLVSTKKNEGTIFYKKPLRSQKGLVGKCILEPNRARCPICHPEYEKFRAWSFINNIRVRDNGNAEWEMLPIDLKRKIYSTLFTSRVKGQFNFKEIRELIEKELHNRYTNDRDNRTINYPDKQNVAACPVVARFIRLLGPDWENWSQTGEKTRSTHGSKTTEQHHVEYDALDLWNVCFNTDDPEEITRFAQERLRWEPEKAKLLVRLWSSMSQGYAMLSLKAIRSINRTLEMGLKYSDAVMLAKVPDIVSVADIDISSLHKIYCQIESSNRQKKTVIGIINALIADYKALCERERFAYKDYHYKLQDSDHDDIINKIKSTIGDSTWSNMDADEQTTIIQQVTNGYQQFFADSKRAFLQLPRLQDDLIAALTVAFPHVNEDQWKHLYHPSQISVYRPVQSGTDRSTLRLGTPNVGSIRNPVVMRTLNVLRHKINAMLDAELVDVDETRVVVETARDFNDANMRKAIEDFQRTRESENAELTKILTEEFPGLVITDQLVDRARYVIEQRDKSKFKDSKGHVYQLDLTKYRLWLEQGCQCMYTGKMISLKNLLDGNSVDVEHTIPRSKSFDSSDANLTLCDSHYNRAIKKDLMPTELPNYNCDAVIDGRTYTAILPRLKKWEERVEKLQANVEFWKSRAKAAQDKARHDQCMRQRHLWQMELKYWRDKVGHFKRTEITDGFRNSQLVDTGIITKYAVLYLKSIFAHVDVQRGAVTAAYRKMLGLQSIDEKKHRELHSHHAIDAAMLTVIPVAAKRERMLKLYYQLEEAKAQGRETSSLVRALEQERNDCHVGGNVSELGDWINANVLINHRSVDRTLQPAKTLLRSRGKVLTRANHEGRMVPLIAQGDSIRGRLHKESYFGAIKLPVEKDGKPEVLDGHFVYINDNSDVNMVIRVALNSITTEKDLDCIVDLRLRAMVKQIIAERMAQGMSFLTAINLPIWMLDAKGNEIKHDKNGRPLSPLRHVRCKVKAGRGFMTREKSLEIRDHIETSKRQLLNVENREYKHKVYAQNDTNYLFLLYEGIKKGKIDRKSRILNLYEVSKLKQVLGERNFERRLRQEAYYAQIKSGNIIYNLRAIIKVGTRLLLWNESPDELPLLARSELLSRLYVVGKFNTTSSDHVYLRKHLNAQSDNFDLELVANKLNCLIEHVDFEIDELGSIHFKD